MLTTAIVLAIVVALLDHFFGIQEPWRKVVWIGIVVLLIIGILALIFPGLLPVRLGWY